MGVPDYEGDVGPAAPRRAPGRPRDHARTRTILDATTAIVTEVGFDRLRVQDVAERAGASLATIYRRWPTKTALVADAIRQDPGPLVELHDIAARDGLEGILRLMSSQLRTPRGARLAVLAVQVDEPEILAAVRETHVPRIRAAVRAALGRVLGEDDADLDLLADLAPAMVWYQALVTGEDDDAAELARRITALLRR